MGRRSNNSAIGVILVDAIFTPVRKVSYTVEPMHQAQQASYGRLVLEIWTDGTITPVKALGQSARILVEQLSPFAFLIQPGPKEAEPLPLPLSSEQYNMPIEQLNLTSRTLHSLRRNKVSKLGELLEMSERELLSLKKFGQKSLEEVLERLREIGLSPAPEAKPLEGGDEPGLTLVPDEGEAIGKEPES